jgi:hypothetical protein
MISDLLRSQEFAHDPAAASEACARVYASTPGAITSADAGTAGSQPRHLNRQEQVRIVLGP